MSVTVIGRNILVRYVSTYLTREKMGGTVESAQSGIVTAFEHCLNNEPQEVQDSFIATADRKSDKWEMELIEAEIKELGPKMDFADSRMAVLKTKIAKESV